MTELTPSDLYAEITTALLADPGLEDALLSDFRGTVARRFGVTLPAPADLVRDGDGFRLTYGGHDYDLTDPRRAVGGELQDAELELVSAGADAGCPQKALGFGSTSTSGTMTIP